MATLNHPVLIPPALTLPFELVSQIFELCLPDHRRVRPSPQNAPFVLTQICRRWRDISLATPELWSSICLRFPSGTPYDGIQRLFSFEADCTESVDNPICDLVELWLSRAGRSCLSISLMVTSFKLDGSRSLSDDLLETLSGYLSRCARLELDLRENDLLRFNQIAERAGPFYSLRSVSVRCADLAVGHIVPLARSILQAPNLAAICLRGLLYTESWPEIAQLPHSLIALEIGRLPRMDLSQSMATTFAQFPHLQHFVTYTHFTESPRQPPVHASPLTSLVLEGRPGILDTLTIPTLEHLNVQVPYSRDPKPLQTFLSRSECRLRSLTLRLGTVHGEELFPCFAAIPTLATLELLLEIRNPMVHESVCSALKRTDALPHLRTLSITDTESLAPYSLFLEILLARQDTPLAIAELHIRQRHHHNAARQALPEGPIRYGLELLAVRGVRVRVTSLNAMWSNMPARVMYEDDLELNLYGLSRIRPAAFSPF